MLRLISINFLLVVVILACEPIESVIEPSSSNTNIVTRSFEECGYHDRGFPAVPGWKHLETTFEGCDSHLM